MTSLTRFFVHYLNGARKSRIIVGLAIIILGLVGFAEAATDFCQKTAQDALQGCQDAAESARSVAQGKCDNVSDPIARTDCRKQAAADFQDALQTCQDGYASRQAACQKFGPARYDPVIDPANFVRHVTNPFFPLPPGQTFVYEGHTKDGFVHNDFIVTRKTKVILGVTCTEVHDVVYLDGELAEDTLDWYAQDNQGNVWYFGESTAEFEDGRPVTVEGSFTAGVNGDKPGSSWRRTPSSATSIARNLLSLPPKITRWLSVSTRLSRSRRGYSITVLKPKRLRHWSRMLLSTNTTPLGLATS